MKNNTIPIAFLDLFVDEYRSACPFMGKGSPNNVKTPFNFSKMMQLSIVTVYCSVLYER